MALIVFTHGLGANEDFLGSTLDVLRRHERLANHEIKTWGYPTSKFPRLRISRHGRLALRRQNLQTPSEIGEVLWSHLRSWSGDHDKIILVGHSLGGLVSAAALVHGATSSRVRDLRVCAKLRGLICVASPFAGTYVAEWTSHLYRPIGENPQIDDLRSTSDARKSLIQEFREEVLNLDRFTFVLMKATNDETIDPDQITRPFRPSQFLPDELEGSHSGCIRDLGIEHPNLEKLVTAIEGSLNPDAAGQRITKIAFLDSRSVTIGEWYDHRLRQMTSHLDILAWGLAMFREDYGKDLNEWAERGVKIRIILVNPDSQEGSTLCRLQDISEEREIGSTQREILRFLATIRPVNEKLQVRVSDHHPGVNIFRIDDEMFFGPYIAGIASRKAPTGFVLQGQRLFERLTDHFEWMWSNAYDTTGSSSGSSSDSHLP